MLSISVTLRGDKEFLGKLHKLGDRLTNFTVAMRQIKEELVNYYSGQVFASEGGATGEKWAGLSPVYANWKAAHYRGRGINIRTGKLQHFMQGVSDKSSATISNPVSYFQYIQLGTSRMPARPILVVNNDVKDIVGNIIKMDIEQKIDAGD